MSKSIRWRLAASFAGIALLATLALGAVLLTIVRGYYARQERAYLESSSQALASIMSIIVRSDFSPDMVQTQVENLSFLAQSRVRLLDANEGLIADSGPPASQQIVSLGMRGGVMFQRPVTEALPSGVDVMSFSADIAPPMPPADDARFVVVESGVITDPMGATIVDLQVPVAGGPYGFSVNEQDSQPIQRSAQHVQQPIEAVDGTVWGYLELSEGPAYGTQIVRSVARGWTVASGVAVLLSAAVGWWVSRSLSAPLLHLAQTTASMAEGDLSARASETERQDELGMLAHTFNEMADRVEETVITLRCFVSDAAHEIHTPLSTIRTNLDLLPADDAVIRAQTQVARLEALTVSLLDLSRIEANQAGSPHQPVDLKTLVLEIGEVYASRAEQAGLEFDLVAPDGDLIVQGDPVQLQRALANLMDNACKFTPQGGQVRVSVRADKGHAVVNIEDTGIGIPEQDIPLLFGRFHRGRNTAAYSGSGLGLAIVKAVVERHEGSVDVTSGPGGTRFTVSLPLSEAE